MKKYSQILVVGNFGYANHDLSGQTVKTRVVYEMLKKNTDSVGYFDTQTLHNRLNFISLINNVIHSRTIVYLPAHGNLKYLLPLYYILSLIFNFDIIYCVIGGWLVKYLKTKPIHRYMLKRIKVILAETQKMKNDLEREYGFENVEVMDNFRITEFRPNPTPQLAADQTLKLVFMARVDPKKGLDTILNFCDYINGLTIRPNISVSFFGPLTKQAGQDFLDKVASFDFVSYHGELEPDEIYDTLKEYDISLLPTHYYTEGLPGTIIDSYLSGIPVIVSDWLHSHEFVEDGVTGLIIPFENNQDEFNETIISLYSDRNRLLALKKGAVKFGERFRDDAAWNIIAKYI